MKRSAHTAMAAACLVAAGAAITTVLGVDVADGSPATPAATHKPATFEMFADVTAGAMLKSNYDASGARMNGNFYIVTFRRKIAHCAVDVQVGVTGASSDVVFPADATVTPNGKHSISVFFTEADDQSPAHVPFMTTLTCRT